jgi:hypothetical protein
VHARASISAALLTVPVTMVDVRSASQFSADPRDARIFHADPHIAFLAGCRHEAFAAPPIQTAVQGARNADALLDDLRRPFRASITP